MANSLSFSTVPGFRFSAVPAGIRKDGRVDVALAVSDAPATTAGVFTRNLVRAAPVVVTAERVQGGVSRAILVNSGCANACTGDAGRRAVLDSTAAVAKELSVPVEHVLAASTGVIGELLPASRISRAAASLVEGLEPAGHREFAQAICTTDRWPKVAWAALSEQAEGPRLLAIAKGAGMIHPDLGLLVPSAPAAGHATMLVFLFTDAAVERTELEQALVTTVDRTFNCCSVDGDTSTNDTVLALASGVSPAPVSSERLREALFSVCDELARSMVLDGEGSEHAVLLRVVGLGTDAEAARVARTIATSLLVKTALHGRDANWGRLLAAAGRSGVGFDPGVARISIGDILLVQNGLAVGSNADQQATAVMAQPTYDIEVALGEGPGQARYWMTDLGHGYVNVNATYRS